MTLGGLALGAGMLVDNAIVVMENIFRNMDENNLPPAEAAVRGTSEVAGAITASTLTTIVVFLPIVYLQGAAGELFKEQAWTVSFSLLSSLFVSILFIDVYKRQGDMEDIDVEMNVIRDFTRRVLLSEETFQEDGNTFVNMFSGEWSGTSKLNKYDLSSMYFNYAGSIYSQNFPIIDIVMNTMLKQEEMCIRDRPQPLPNTT